MNTSKDTSKTSVSKHELKKGSGSSKNLEPTDDLDGTAPVFIYGGPFIKLNKPEPFLDTATPINIQLQGTFKKSFAYYSLKDRLPVILTKVIDFMSREGSKVKANTGASDLDIQNMIRSVSKLKNDLITNKPYERFEADTEEARKWNSWMDSLDNTRYFNNIWVWSECYVYRKLYEYCELNKGLIKFDPFEEQKQKAFSNSLEPMCIVAERMAEFVTPGEKDKRKADFQLLLKVCLWANKCDLSLSMGEEAKLMKEEGKPEEVNRKIVDPFQMIIDLKDKLLVDDSGKAADQIQIKAENISKAIEGQKPEEPPKPAEGVEALVDEKPPIPCPAKMTLASTVLFDIVCDNAGYELFADLCFAHFLLAQSIVKKVRFHIKKYPWFVSDVVHKDFTYVIDQCSKASYNREVPAEPKPAPAEGEAPPPEPPRIINADALRQLGDTWKKYVDEGQFLVMAEDYWTYPHVYKDMKKYDFYLYRKLQLSCGILFKGDLNYRKLLGERNCNPTLGFEAALQGFIPAPIIAVRTVKADLICALPKGKWEQLNKIDDKWMEKGDYGVIHYCNKAEALKVSDRPCEDYGGVCRGVVCPEHKDM